jgi:hypothetical protein
MDENVGLEVAEFWRYGRGWESGCRCEHINSK